MLRFVRPCRASALAATVSATITATVFAFPAVAAAQAPGGGLPQGGMGGEEETKPEGVAEKAPVDPSKVLTPPTMRPWPGEEKKAFEHFSLDGYLRLRTDWFSNFHLGFHDNGGAVPPFREPLTCLNDAGPTPGLREGCSESIGTANMRLRLEPTYWVTEKVAIKMQIDVLDNLVLGATPEGTFYDGTVAPANIPTNAFTGGQATPEAGRNYVTDSIRVKRAWAEVMTPLGLLRFGRMPSHWGLGMLANGGGADPFHSPDDPFYKNDGAYCLDCDYGDTADRVIFGTKIPGTNLTAAIGMDWAATGPTAAQTAIWQNRTEGQPWDLVDTDDLKQWVLVIANLDKPDEWLDKIATGEAVMNYGVYGVYRTQDFTEGQLMFDSNTPQVSLVHRGATAYIGDAYFRFGKKKLNFEAEAAVIYGTIDTLNDLLTNLVDQDVLQGGAVARFNYLLVDDTLNLGLEAGFASGDQWEGPAGTTNVLDGSVVPASTEDHTLSAFHFDFNYHVDMILFRELLGTISNATYVKPSLMYNLTDRIAFKASAVASFANVRVSTPGNGLMYGVELDGDLGYRNRDEGFFAGISYGVLFPLDAMDHPVDIYGADGQDASTAQRIQMRVAVKF